MDYEAFMQSCFINSRFAKGILSEMKHISNFSDNTKEITKALEFTGFILLIVFGFGKDINYGYKGYSVFLPCI